MYGNIAEEEVIRDSIENGAVLFPPVIRTMGDLLAEHIDDDASEDFDYPMITISNDKFLNGAAVIMYPGVMDKIAEMAGDSYFIIPSSIHDLIAIPEYSGMTGEDLNSMIREVNSNYVEDSEILSGHAYHYDADKKIFESVEDYEKRIGGKHYA